MEHSGFYIDQIEAAYQALVKLGWSSAVYAPRNGKTFAVLELNRKGLWGGYYTPEGFIRYGPNLKRPDGLLWKPQNGLSQAEKDYRTLTAMRDQGWVF